MGVNIFLLDRRTADLLIGRRSHTVGTLRRFFKITELDESRAAERAAAAEIKPSPAAVIVMDITELPIAGAADTPVAAHLVLGWDEGRGSVTDFGWDYLPRLGYAVRDKISGSYTLYEERSDLLHLIDRARAHALGLLDADERLLCRGQPRIAACHVVRPYIDGFAEAECTFDDGRQEKLLVRTTGDVLPEPTWLTGKKPMEIEDYRPERRSGAEWSGPQP